MRLYLIFIFLCMSAPGLLMAQTVDDEKAVNEALVRYVDVTGDGIPSRITLHLSAKSIKSPFTWTLTIVSEGNQIYSYSSDDARIDKFFNDYGDNGFVSGCRDYVDCKKKYYYHDILDNLVLTGNQWYDVNGILNKAQNNTLYPLGRKQLRECCNITGKKADAILSKIEHKLRTGKAIAINVPISPVQSNPPLVFVPEIGRFIRIHEE